MVFHELPALGIMQGLYKAKAGHILAKKELHQANCSGVLGLEEPKRGLIPWIQDVGPLGNELWMQIVCQGQASLAAVQGRLSRPSN